MDRKGLGVGSISVARARPVPGMNLETPGLRKNPDLTLRINVLAALPKNSQGSTSAIVSRQAAIDSVRALTVEVRRVDRIEAKLVSGASSPVWLVAVSGDIGCNCIVDASFRSAIYTIDAQSGSIQSVSKTSDLWPASFDGLADEGVGR